LLWREAARALEGLDDFAPIARPVLNVVVNAVRKPRLRIANLFHHRCYLTVDMAASKSDDTSSAMTTAIAAVIRRIPRGRVSTYGAVAEAAGYPRCARHVSKVLNQVRGLPWQRVLGSGGSISLPGELGLEQRFLLQAEGVKFRGRKVDMTLCRHDFPKLSRAQSARGPVPKK
jgi:methylated-DNA-protein-cysteine methyltransferase-like protein